jgi:hypothetical protein
MNDLREDIRSSYHEAADGGADSTAEDLRVVTVAREIYRDKRRWAAVMKLNAEQNRAVAEAGKNGVSDA